MIFAFVLSAYSFQNELLQNKFSYINKMTNCLGLDQAQYVIGPLSKFCLYSYHVKCGSRSVTTYCS